MPPRIAGPAVAGGPQAGQPEPILALLGRQRTLLTRSDVDAALELDEVAVALQSALDALARPADAAMVDRLRHELRLNQATLARVADVNRRALHTLFGEPTLYGR